MHLRPDARSRLRVLMMASHLSRESPAVGIGCVLLMWRSITLLLYVMMSVHGKINAHVGMPTSPPAPPGLRRSHHLDSAANAGARRSCPRRAPEHRPAAPTPVGTPVRARARRRRSGEHRRQAARHDVLDGYRASNTTATTSMSAARAAVTGPPSLVLLGSARRCRIPCRPRV